MMATEQTTLAARQLASSTVAAEAGQYPASLRILSRVSRRAGCGQALRITTARSVGWTFIRLSNTKGALIAYVATGLAPIRQDAPLKNRSVRISLAVFNL